MKLMLIEVVKCKHPKTWLLSPITILIFLQGCHSSKRVSDPDPYAATASGFVENTNNGGKTWAPTSTTAIDGSAVNSIFVNSAGTIYAGTAHGNVFISTTNGVTWTKTSAQPNPGYAVNAIFVTGSPSSAVLYAATAKGNVEISTNGGSSWTATTYQPDASSVESIFVTSTGAIYAGTANGNVEYTTNKTSTWKAINGKPDGSPVKSIFILSSELYVGTADESVYTSTSLTGNGSWKLYAQSVYSLFVASDGNIYAGSQGGYSFSVTQGAQLGFVAYSPVTSLYFSN